MKEKIITLFDFLLPRICPSCNSKLSIDENFICEYCLSQLDFVTPRIKEIEYKRDFEEDGIIEDFNSIFQFESDGTLQPLIHQLKYKSNFRIGIYLGNLIAGAYYSEIERWKPDLLIPVPLHHVKKAERGYNQSFYIAKGIASRINIAVSERILIRKKYTQTQTHLSRDKRKENMRNAFLVKKKEKVIGKRCIIVDDVITTGSTINACGLTLKQSGADKIYALSVGLTQ